MKIETSITALLSECSSFKSTSSSNAERGTERHAELSGIDSVSEIIRMVEKATKSMIVKVIDIEGTMIDESSDTVSVSSLSHRKGRQAYSLSFSVNGMDILVTGVPDLVLLDDRNRIVVVDHKTGGTIHDFRQVGAYALMVGRSLGHDSGAVLAYIHHDMAGDSGDPIIRFREQNHEQLESFFLMIEDLIQKKLSLSLRFTSYCRWCANRSKCPEVQLSMIEDPVQMELSKKVDYYLTNKEKMGMFDQMIKRLGEDILAEVDMGEVLPEGYKIKERMGSDFDFERLSKDYPNVYWSETKPVGVTEARKIAKANDIKIDDYETKKLIGRSIDRAK